MLCPYVVLIIGLRPYANAKDALLHACIHGHHKRSRAILRQPNSIKHTETVLSCLQVAAIKTDAVLTKLLINASLKTFGENVLGALMAQPMIESGGGELKNFAEIVAASGSLELSKCLFMEYPKAMWETSCSPHRALQLARESGHHEIESQMKIWFSSYIHPDEHESQDADTKEVNIKGQKWDAKKNLVSLMLKISSFISWKENANKDEAATRLSGFFECPVCMEVMSGGSKIFACSNDHWLCADCTTHEQVKLYAYQV